MYTCPDRLLAAIARVAQVARVTATTAVPTTAAISTTAAESRLLGVRRVRPFLVVEVRFADFVLDLRLTLASFP